MSNSSSNNNEVFVENDWYTPISSIGPAIDRLRETSRTRKTHGLEWRLSQIRALERLVREHQEDLSRAMHQDMGQSSHYCELFEFMGIFGQVRYFSQNLGELMQPEIVPTPFPLNMSQPTTSQIVQRPRGVVLILAPWNFPISLALKPLMNALAAGNCCVVKPSEVSKHTSRLLGRLIAEYLDPAAITVVQGGVEQCTELLDHHRFDAICYTGGLRVAQIVAQKAALTLTPLLLELGGKSPAIVCSDADVEAAAVRIAWAKYVGNCGQVCVAPDYVLILEHLKDAFVARVKKLLLEIYDPSPRESKDYGRIITQAHSERIVEFLNDRRVKILHGDQTQHKPSERYVEPTLVEVELPTTELPFDELPKILQEEIFGPILPVVAVESEQAAVDFVNRNFNDRNHHPLIMYVFSKSKHWQTFVTDRVQSGMVCVNHTIAYGANLYLPFGGVGYSGVRAHSGIHGFRFFSHPRGQLITNNHSLGPAWAALPPITPAKTRVVRFFSSVPVFMDRCRRVAKLVVLPTLVATLVYRCPPEAILDANLRTLLEWGKGLVRSIAS